MDIPIITIDGPGGTGKGTISRLIAKALGWQLLESGLLYRVLGYKIQEAGIGLENEDKIQEIAAKMQVKLSFDGETTQVSDDDKNITTELQMEGIGGMASKLGVQPGVRDALNICNRSYLTLPGLVAEGRDMGSVVFPEAKLKVYLDASTEVRAKRRADQLLKKGLDVNLKDIFEKLERRDARDRNRDAAPLVIPEGALVCDTSDMTIEQVFSKILERVHQVYPQVANPV